MFKIKYGVNKMHLIIFSHQVGWFDGKGVDIHPWAEGSKVISDIIMFNDGMLIVYILHS
jgi:hypothetical protein